MTADLTPIDLLGPDIHFTGLASVEPSLSGGVRLHRLPEWTRHQIVDPTIGLLETMSTGAHLSFVTSATTIELDVQATLLRFDDDPAIPAAFDLVVDGEVVAGRTTDVGTHIVLQRSSTEIDFVPGPPATVRFDDLADHEKLVEIWLPHAAAVDLLALRLDGSASAPPQNAPRRWIHYGSSISHCLEADRPAGVWPVVAARLAGVELRSLALAGQAQLDQFVARTIRDSPADLLSFKLGINLVNADSMRERTFVPAVHGFLDTVRDGHPDTPIIIITPILCPVAEDRPGPTFLGPDGCRVVDRPDDLALGALTLQGIRSLLADIVRARVDHGDANLHLLEGTDLFGLDDVADLGDGLHPNAAGYRRMGERFHALAFGASGSFVAHADGPPAGSCSSGRRTS